MSDIQGPRFPVPTTSAALPLGLINLQDLGAPGFRAHLQHYLWGPGQGPSLLLDLVWEDPGTWKPALGWQSPYAMTSVRWTLRMCAPSGHTICYL